MGLPMLMDHRDHTYLERECALGPFWQKKWQLQQARLFYKMAEFFLYLKSSKLPLNLLCYTAVLVFFQKWPKPAQLNILSLGVTTISILWILIQQDSGLHHRKAVRYSKIALVVNDKITT